MSPAGRNVSTFLATPEASMTFIVVRQMIFGPPTSSIDHPVKFYEMRQTRYYFLVAAQTLEGTTEIKQVFRLHASPDERRLEQQEHGLEYEPFIEAIDRFHR